MAMRVLPVQRRLNGLVGMAMVFCMPWGQMCGQTSSGSAKTAKTAAAATTPPPATATLPELPGAIYKEAMQPLDVVRSSLENWSDPELHALAIGLKIARDACDRATPGIYTGEDLYDLAHLCSFGQDWEIADKVALAYIASGAETHRTQAYVLSMNALMRMNQTDAALQTAQTMLRTLPYDAEAAYALKYMKAYLEQNGNAKAMALAAEEHAAIVKSLQTGVPLKAVHGDAVIGVGVLYESAMELAFLQRYAGDDVAAAATVADVQGALLKSATLSAEDQQRVNAVTTQYQLLGTVYRPIKPLRSFQTAQSVLTARTAAVQRAAAKAQIGPEFGPATVLVLFPDWCMQCRKMMTTLTEFNDANKSENIRAYGLMFFDEQASGGVTPSDEDLKDLFGTSALLVPYETARDFGAVDYPLCIVLDKNTTIRYVGVLPGDAFKGNGYIEKVIYRMLGNRGSAMNASK